MDIGDLIKRCIRILFISTKPTNSEYSKVARVTALGMVVLGVVGFVISILFGFIR